MLLLYARGVGPACLGPLFSRGRATTTQGCFGPAPGPRSPQSSSRQTSDSCGHTRSEAGSDPARILQIGMGASGASVAPTVLNRHPVAGCGSTPGRNRTHNLLIWNQPGNTPP